jgi:hypothetical protein
MPVDNNRVQRASPYHWADTVNIVFFIGPAHGNHDGFFESTASGRQSWELNGLQLQRRGKRIGRAPSTATLNIRAFRHALMLELHKL